MNKYKGWIAVLSIGICILLLAICQVIFPLESAHGIILGGALCGTGLTGIIDAKRGVVYGALQK